MLYWLLHLLIYLLLIDWRVWQNYLREQPDNLKSFNIVAETAQFVNLVYSNITPQNIDLASQLFETLNEFTVVCRAIHYITAHNPITIRIFLQFAKIRPGRRSSVKKLNGSSGCNFSTNVLKIFIYVFKFFHSRVFNSKFSSFGQTF